MYSHRLVRRASCNAQNAFDPALALTRTLCLEPLLESASILSVRVAASFATPSPGCNYRRWTSTAVVSDNVRDAPTLASQQARDANAQAAENVRRFLELKPDVGRASGTYANLDRLIHSVRVRRPISKDSNRSVRQRPHTTTDTRTRPSFRTWQESYSPPRERVTDNDTEVREISANARLRFRYIVPSEKKKVDPPESIAVKPDKLSHDGEVGNSEVAEPSGRTQTGFEGSGPRHSQRSQHPGFRLVAPEHDRAFKWQPEITRISQRAAARSNGNGTMPPNVLETEEQQKEAMEYTARLIPPRRSLLLKPLPAPWAVDQNDMSQLSGDEILDKEIVAFAQDWNVSSIERIARQAVIEEITSLVETVFGPGSFQLSGSETTGLAMTTSDIDVCVRKREEMSNKEFLTAFRKLYKTIHENPSYMITTLRLKNYFIINTQHIATGIDVQLVHAPDTGKQRNATLQYIDEIPHLKNVYMVLHTALSMRGLIDVFKGGIGSYGLFMMLVASVTSRNLPLPATGAGILQRFLDFYTGFDTSRYGVSVKPGKVFKKHDGEQTPCAEYAAAALRRQDPVRGGQWRISKLRRHQPYLFCLQDPVNPINDLGYKSHAVKHMFLTFGHMRHKLRWNLSQGAEIAKGRSPGANTMLAPLLGRCHEVYLARRQKVREFGRTIRREHDEASTAALEEQAPHPSDRQIGGGPEHEEVDAA